MESQTDANGPTEPGTGPDAPLPKSEIPCVRCRLNSLECDLVRPTCKYCQRSGYCCMYDRRTTDFFIGDWQDARHIFRRRGLVANPVRSSKKNRFDVFFNPLASQQPDPHGIGEAGARTPKQSQKRLLKKRQHKLWWKLVPKPQLKRILSEPLYDLVAGAESKYRESSDDESGEPPLAMQIDRAGGESGTEGIADSDAQREGRPDHAGTRPAPPAGNPSPDVVMLDSEASNVSDSSGTSSLSIKLPIPSSYFLKSIQMATTNHEIKSSHINSMERLLDGSALMAIGIILQEFALSRIGPPADGSSGYFSDL
ncbi:hypothetical protein EV182_002382 [Spiromyces aspiralis]|uniref:Uncharacterized protein n=1 Tax=Spiromyces aspiralis TaxID=68401 RepID=A0ACC1HRU5_9FUNG|nr:hypothetical protein EV182_002382 [Spiromyces aspiralis]